MLLEIMGCSSSRRQLLGPSHIGVDLEPFFPLTSHRLIVRLRRTCLSEACCRIDLWSLPLSLLEQHSMELPLGMMVQSKHVNRNVAVLIVPSIVTRRTDLLLWMDYIAMVCRFH